MIDSGVSWRLLRVGELSLFSNFVKDHFRSDHSYVQFPEVVRHFYQEDEWLNIFAAFANDEIIGVWPYLYYNEQKTDAAGGLFLFKPLNEMPFIGQKMLKKFIEELSPRSLFTAGITPRLVKFYQRINHECSAFQHFYWNSMAAKPLISNVKNNVVEIDVYGTDAGLGELHKRFPKHTFLPRKDFWFLRKSYVENCSQKFRFFSSDDQLDYVFVTASYETPIGKVLRLYDFFGDHRKFGDVLYALASIVEKEKFTYVDVIISGIDSALFEKAGYQLVSYDDGADIIPNNFFPFEAKNTQVICGVRLNDAADKKMPCILFKGTGDQIIPRKIKQWHIGLD